MLSAGGTAHAFGIAVDDLGNVYTTGNFTGQVSLYARTSQLTYTPDWDAELAFNGVAQQADKKDTTFGVQAEGSWVLTGESRGWSTASGAFTSPKPRVNFSLDGGGWV